SSTHFIIRLIQLNDQRVQPFLRMLCEPAMFVGPERGDQFTSLDRGDDGHIAGKGLIPPNVVVVIVTVDQRGYWLRGECRDRLPQICCGCRRDKGVEDENPVSQVNDARIALCRTTFLVSCCEDSICQLMKLEMG